MRANARICDGCGTPGIAVGHATSPARWTRARFAWTGDDGVSRQASVDLCPDPLCAARALTLARERSEGPLLRALPDDALGALRESSESVR